MGFWDRFRRSSGPAHPSPAQLRDELFRRVEGHDAAGLEELCRAEQQRIRALFPGWRSVPQELRRHRAAVQRSGQGLLGIAVCFDQRLGDRSLLELLMGRPEDNPITQWQERLRATRGLMDGARYADAIQELEGLLDAMQRLQGSASDRYRPIVLGWLGESHFHAGAAARALDPTTRALTECERLGDVEGVLAYLGNLYEIRRYLGEAGAAADAAERLAAACERAGQTTRAARFRRLASIAREGEPLNRVVATLGDEPREYELDELPAAGSERVGFVFRRNRITLRSAQRLIEAGRERGGAGDYQGALSAFERAAQADRHEPDAPYQAGVALLDLGRYAEARRRFEETESLAPGWYQCRADRALAAELAEGKLDGKVYLALRALQDGDAPPEEKVRLADSALSLAPTSPCLSLERGRILAALGHHTEAVAAFRRGLPCEADPDTQSWLMVRLAGSLDRGAPERGSLLERAAALGNHGGNLVAAATATMLLRAGVGGA